MAFEKQESRFVGLAMTRETSPRVLPATPAWETREPNEFADFGAEYSMVARRPFSASRQRKKGSITDRDDRFGFNEDVTQNNMIARIEEFCFAAARRTAQTFSTAALSANSRYTVTNGASFITGALILASGFGIAANNGLKVVDEAGANFVGTASVLSQEAAAPQGARVKVVGHAFAAGDLAIAKVGAGIVITSDTIDFTDLPLIPGQWVFIGGDSTGDQFETIRPGYARIGVNGIAAGGASVTFDKTTFVVPDGFTSDGAGKTLRIFFGDTIKNEDDPDLIERFTVQAERFLGRDNDGRQTEYLEGGTANELTWNSPLADKLTVDLAYIAMYYGKRKGAEGPKSAEEGATLAKALAEEAFNTTSNVYRLRLGIIDPATLNPTSLFARVTEWTQTITNNTSANKAQGTLGAFDTTSGLFEVDGEYTAYFTTVAAIQAIEDNADVTFDAIYSKRNAAIIMDIPLIGLGGGSLDISMDESIMLPLTTAAAESPFGHTILFGFLPYVPTVGMASA
jgi:hypothetical protein